ncbi:glutathione peroxidase [bacterium]|nr:glutathione peroxidase [bacterium]
MLLRYLLCALLALTSSFGMAAANTTDKDSKMDLLSVPFLNTDGTTETLSLYKGKVVLVVNVASKCGYTPQYAGLEKLYRDNLGDGLVVVAFPSNDFGGQEPGTDLEILNFCRSKYDVTFPVKSKMSTKGPGKSPLYAALTSPSGPYPGEVAWNFEKFLIGRDGQMLGRFKSSVRPDSPELTEAIAKALAK